jgi:hypothetical protein
VLDAAGIEQLGGDDFDLLLARLFARKWGVELDSLRPLQRLHLLARARQQKESISTGAVRSLSLSPKDIGLKGRIASIPVSAYFKELRRLVEPAIDKLLDLVNGQAARQAGIRPESLDAVYLVGGSSKLPLIPEMVARHFPKTRLILSDKPFSSTAMGAAIHASEKVRLHDILGRNFGVIRLADHGRAEYFAPIFLAGMRLPQPGNAPSRHSVDYGPHHNLGHLRYLECTTVGGSGQPSEGVRYWSEAVFPYDPAVPVQGGLLPRGIESRPDLADQTVRETYLCDADGVITVQIQRRCDGQSLCCEIFRV